MQFSLLTPQTLYGHFLHLQTVKAKGLITVSLSPIFLEHTLHFRRERRFDENHCVLKPNANVLQ